LHTKGVTSLSHTPGSRTRWPILLGVTCVVLAARLSLAQAPEAGGQASNPNTASAASNPCARASPAYIHVATETGGLPWFLQRSEAAKIGHFMRESSGTNRETLLWATGTFERGVSRSFTVPVDSTVERMTLSLSVDAPESALTLVRPSGAPVVGSDSNTETTELVCGRVTTVVSPAAGDWRAEVSGSGRFWFQASAQAKIFLSSVQFVKPGGRPGHEGMFRIAGQPLAGVPATLEIHLSGPVHTANFRLVTPGAETIKPLSVKAVSTSADESEYAGEFDLPQQPFRVAVTGEDSKGNAYQRFYASLFHAETVEVVRAGDPLDDLPPGKTTPVRFTVRNIGPPSNFRIVVADSKRFVSRVDPEALSLETGASATVTVDVSVPSGTPPGTGLDLTITASSTSSPAGTNGAVAHLAVFESHHP
jgi:von Willebrand factor A domain-containing protein 7